MFWAKSKAVAHRFVITGPGAMQNSGSTLQRLLAPWISRNLDFVATNKIRRGVSLYRLYSDLWSKERLRLLLIQMGKRVVTNLTRKRATLLSGTALFASSPEGVSSCHILPKVEAQQNHKAKSNKPDESGDGGSDRLKSDPAPKPPPPPLIPDEVMTSHARDLDYAHKLTRVTLTCQACGARHLIDQQVEGVSYCQCPEKKSSVYDVVDAKCGESDTCWAPFLERKDVIVWRREHHQHRGLYAYKMYGRFDDVTASEFLDIQMDLSELRLKWDNSTAQCHIIKETHHSTAGSSNDFSTDWSQVYYWEVNWPRFFSNRDYVAARRAVIIDSENPQDKRIVVYSKSTDHSSYPAKSKTVRVEDYISVLTIRPFTSFDQPGIEFSLTAFENPGLSLPSSITTWVALRAMPEFMGNLRKACLDMRKWKQQHAAAKNGGYKQGGSSENSTPSSTPKEPPHIETPASTGYQNMNQQQQSSVYA